MAFSSFKDLVIDATDAARTAAFWADLLGLTAETAGAGPNAVLNGAVPEHTIWINQVPEPRTVKQRVHLDVHAAAVSDALRLGAVVDTEHPGWTVLRDPEGGEFCVFPRPPDQLPNYRLYEVVVDAADPAMISSWWAERFGVPAGHDESDPWFWLDGGQAGLPWDLIFNPVPEPKSVKNRVHWDVWGDTEDFLAAGATLLRARDDPESTDIPDSHKISWDVLADPEGNEFCVFAR
ncbi:hypothetical protein FOE78_19575 [Microlunatus elymi]|uniref:Glyoxalase-like domain-containing protein n=1 Tax=Microlunatus elymi TaxID=2596828 RepID=A0A516Q303_9ACTN|nr:VOC family protein [Microlunatus elymi]QDP97814.1 hypothetical protein FOE78_19575 [Microlunatus elymi]